MSDVDDDADDTRRKEADDNNGNSMAGVNYYYRVYANLECYCICRTCNISPGSVAGGTSPWSVHCDNSVKYLCNVLWLRKRGKSNQLNLTP